MEKNLVQTKNPRTDRYVKIDKSLGKILETKKTKGPYKNIPIVRKKKVKKIMNKKKEYHFDILAVARKIFSEPKEEDFISYSEEDLIEFGMHLTDITGYAFLSLNNVKANKKAKIKKIFKEWLKQK